MSRIAFFVATFFALSITSPAFVDAGLAPRASGTPSQCFICPPADAEGFPLGENSISDTSLFCSYPAVEGEDPMDFFCTYDTTSGALIEDNDVGLCFPTADTAQCNSRRDDNFKAVKRRAEARARSRAFAAKPRSSRPDARGVAAKKRRSVDNH